MSNKKSTFISIGNCEVCGNTGMELFHSLQGLACVTCKETVDVREPMQQRTAENHQKEMQFIRDMLEGHGGH